jgi:hypothetical protein
MYIAKLNFFGGMKMSNQDIRQEVIDAGLKLWQIAYRLNLSDGDFSRKLRREFSAAEKQRIRKIIKCLSEERAGEA